MQSFQPRPRAVHKIGLLLLGLCLCAKPFNLARADEFPTKPVKIVVPAAAGGGLDTVARLLTEKIQSIWKYSVYIENKPGANWIVGMNAVANAAPDGYTLLFIASSGLTVTPNLFPNMPLDPLRDLTPVISTTRTTFVLLVNPKVPAKSVSEFIAYLKAHPGKLNHGSNSATTILISELFKQRAGVDFVDVNFRGAVKSIIATMAGNTQFCFADLSSATGPIHDGTVRPLGVTAGERFKLKPNIPTLAEQGLPGFSVYSGMLSMAPAKTPPELVKKIGAAFKQVLMIPDVQSRLGAMGQLVEPLGPEETAKELFTEAKQWKKLIEQRHITYGR